MNLALDQVAALEREYWDRGRLARSERRQVRDPRRQKNLFALRAHGGRVARGPSE